MNHKSEEEAAVAEHLLQLRGQAVAALRLFDKIADRLHFYERHLALSKNYNVRLAGPFLVIKGGQSGETKRAEKGPVKNKILIVEDNNDFREILHLFITKIGYQTINAKNSTEAIAFAEAEKPGLIFMDIDLPDVDGVKTTAILKQNPKTAHIPVVALTAWMSELWREKATKAGIADYLLKPVSPQMLKETIEEYTNQSLTRGKAMTQQ